MATVKLGAVVINARDLEQIVEFWGSFLEVEERHRVPGMVWLKRQSGASMSLAVQQVDDPTEGRNRLHLDFGSDDAETSGARVLELGGSQVEDHEVAGFHWTAYADPEGNEFCIAQADPDDHT